MWMVQPPPWFTFIVILNCQDMHMHRCHRWDAQKTSVWEAMHLTCLHNIALSIVCFSRSLAWDATCLICEAKCTNWDLEFRDMFLDFLTTLPEPKDRQWHGYRHGYRPRLTTAFCKKYRHVFSCLWQEHSSDSVEGYELYRCIYDHLDSGTHLLFDCDCVIFFILTGREIYFHGTPIGCIPSILMEGLLPSSAGASMSQMLAVHSFEWTSCTPHAHMRFLVCMSSQHREYTWPLTSARHWVMRHLLGSLVINSTLIIFVLRTVEPSARSERLCSEPKQNDQLPPFCQAVLLVQLRCQRGSDVWVVFTHVSDFSQ